MHISSLPHRYTAAQLHFHWGSPSKPAGSEHTVNGKRYAAEVNAAHDPYFPLLVSVFSINQTDRFQFSMSAQVK